MTAPRPLAESDDRTGFNCGRASLDEWFRRHAWRNHAGDVSRVYVACCAETGRIAAFASLSAAAIERAVLPKAQQRDRPDPVPVILLGRLAVDVGFQGRGLATDMLRFALMGALAVSRTVGAMGVLTHPIDDGVRGFYARHGFVELPGDPARAMLVRMVDLGAAIDDASGR